MAPSLCDGFFVPQVSPLHKSLRCNMMHRYNKIGNVTVSNTSCVHVGYRYNCVKYALNKNIKKKKKNEYSTDTGTTRPMMGFRLRIEKHKYRMKVGLKIFLYFLLFGLLSYQYSRPTCNFFQRCICSTFSFFLFLDRKLKIH